MSRSAKDVTDAELAVLEVLWQRGRSAIRELTDALYPGGGASELATVQKLCERLTAKGFVARDRRTRPQVFSAAIDRQELIGRQLRQVADKLCAGSLTPLLTHLVAGRALSKDEIAELSALIERLDYTRPAKEPGRRRKD
jgi:predicted transcriptional regulator